MAAHQEGHLDPDAAPYAPDLTDAEETEVEQHRALRADVVHEAIRREGEEELGRSSSALAWSGLAAGLSMGFSLVAESLIREHLPEAPWRPLVAKLGYTVGYLIVILGRQQLYTENTLTVILPLLARRNAATLWQVLRLWGVVLAANLAGALAFAWVIGHTAVFEPRTRQVFAEIGREAMIGSFGVILLRGVFAGWLIALMVWMLPVADTSRAAIIVIITYVVGLAGFPHVIAGSAEALYEVTRGAAGWGAYLGGYLAPTFLGNTLGGVALVAALNHAQVIAGENQQK